MRIVGLLILIILMRPAAAGQSFPLPQSGLEQGTVMTPDKAVTYLAPSGQARITFLAQGKNAFVGRLWLAPHAKVPLHQDQTEEYLYILEGRGMLKMNDQEYQLKAGMTVFMPANAKVTFKNGDQPTVCLQIFSGPDSAKKYKSWPKETQRQAP